MLFRSILMEACGFIDYQVFTEQHRIWVEDALKEGRSREGHWTESIAVGSSSFIEETKSKLGCCAGGRKLDGQTDGACFLKEEGESYTAGFAGKSEALSAENAFFWAKSAVTSGGWLGPTPSPHIALTGA